MPKQSPPPHFPHHASSLLQQIDDVGFQRALYASLEGIFKETQAITRAQAEALMANMSALMMRCASWMAHVL